eukprot:GILK01005606.1.p1 GENE.GILK01005606.1~~GILK01005606.1.p1  ORF type:complete len:204 (-),score=7.27 GILK01005606.1:510-1121(-)
MQSPIISLPMRDLTPYTHPLLSGSAEVDGTIPDCRICGEDATIDSLKPCNCTGSLERVHMKCLQRWIQTKSSNHLTCEICHAPYLVRVRYRLVWDKRLISCSSFGHYIEMCFLLLMLACFGIMMIFVGPLASWDQQGEKICVLIVFLFTFGTALLALVRVFQRWRAENSEVVIEPSRSSVPMIEVPLSVRIETVPSYAYQEMP